MVTHKRYSGSHVVIFNDAPSDTTIKEAAMLAGYFSKAGNSGQIPVDYTLIKMCTNHQVQSTGL